METEMNTVELNPYSWHQQGSVKSLTVTKVYVTQEISGLEILNQRADI